MTEKEQLELLPETMPKGKFKNIQLAEVPQDLPGPGPTAELIASIEKFGVVLPIVVIESTRGGLYRVADGRRRIAAARKLKLPNIPARVYVDDGLMMSSEVLTISLNRLRSSNPAAELMAIESLIKQGATKADIRWATGLPQGTIEKRMRLQALNKRLRDGLTDGTIAVSVAEAAASLPNKTQVRLARKLTKNGKVTMADVKEEKSARAVNELEQIPADVFTAPGTSWRDQVIERLNETIKLIPDEEDGARSRLAQFMDWLAESG